MNTIINQFTTKWSERDHITYTAEKGLNLVGTCMVSYDGVGYVATSRYRWVVEFCVHRKRHRFRTTNFCNAVKQLLYWREIFNS